MYHVRWYNVNMAEYTGLFLLFVFVDVGVIVIPRERCQPYRYDIYTCITTYGENRYDILHTGTFPYMVRTCINTIHQKK